MPSTIVSLLERLAQRGLCELSPPSGQPQVGGHRLPDDVIELFEKSDGALLFGDSEHPTRVLPTQDIGPIDDLMWDGEPAPDDSSRSWFRIADDAGGNYVSIDLSPDRHGWCYDTQLGRYGEPGDCPVIALSLTEFLERSASVEGGYFYWMREDFTPHGDAYDDNSG